MDQSFSTLAPPAPQGHPTVAQPTNREIILQTINLTKRYGQRLAVNGLN